MIWVTGEKPPRLTPGATVFCPPRRAGVGEVSGISGVGGDSVRRGLDRKTGTQGTRDQDDVCEGALNRG